MNQPVMRPKAESELIDLVASSDRVVPVGNRSKPTLSRFTDDDAFSGATVVSLSSMTGVIEYEPSEFTFTAWAGTRVDEMKSVLDQRNQYLPFDPMLSRAGATLGGTVATGMSGPGRFRYGGVRDFLIGANFVSGEGQLIRAGGKVVKNAAGFDIPKLMVGSLGSLGVMTSLTFKVFPLPVTVRTLAIACQSDAQAMDRTARAAASRWELDAIDYRPNRRTVYLRLAGPDVANQAIESEISKLWGADVSPLDGADEFWTNVTEISWSPRSPWMLKVPITTTEFLDFQSAFGDHAETCSHLSAAANVLWLAVDDAATIGTIEKWLREKGMSAIVVRGNDQRRLVGNTAPSEMAIAVKKAMDPQNRLPSLWASPSKPGQRAETIG